MIDSKDELPVISGARDSPSIESRPRNRKNEIRLVLMGVAALVSYLGVLHIITPIDILAIGASLIGGYPVFVETFRALRHRSINMEVSMTVAIVASLLVAQFTAAVVVTFFVLLSEYIESYAVDKGRATITKLEESIPRRALVRRNGAEVETDVSRIGPGEVVIVRVGERIPVDGVIVKGSGFVNQSAITGEAFAVEKVNGSRVFAGSIDESGILEVNTEKVGTETVFGQIIKLVEEAEGRKAPIQKLSDKLATWLVEFTILFAVITFVITRNLISTISVIVVAGACGVAAGTPLAIVAVMGGLAKKGVIVKGGVYIQEMSKIDTVVVDKTGTLTQGRPEVTDIVELDDCSQKQVLTYAAAAERLSSHPLARAIATKAQELGASPTGSASSQYLAGKGIISLYEGERVLVGNSVLMKEQDIVTPGNAQAAISGEVSKGMTTVIVAHGGRTCGVIGISDKVRSESRKAVQELERMGISTIMLTGDNKVAAQHVGEKIGIKQVYAELLPTDKVSIIERLSDSGEKIAMVGDGINDAPALARANVGIGMGAGTDIAIGEADIVLMTNDLGKIPTIVKASKQAYGVILQNFYGTLIVDGIGLALAFDGLLNPLFAAGIHVASELVFILNSARLIR
jgi:P-type Cu+ transporter